MAIIAALGIVIVIVIAYVEIAGRCIGYDIHAGVVVGVDVVDVGFGWNRPTLLLQLF